MLGKKTIELDESIVDAIELIASHREETVDEFIVGLIKVELETVADTLKDELGHMPSPNALIGIIAKLRAIARPDEKESYQQVRHRQLRLAKMGAAYEKVRSGDPDKVVTLNIENPLSEANRRRRKIEKDS